MQGVLSVLKPPGMTSHDVVSFARRTLGLKRIGHTGTLDPAAAGVLAVCVGPATRLVEYLQTGSKEYVAEITFGYETNTLDAVGQIVREATTEHVTPESLQNALPQFLGDIQQMPPLYSAIKQDGKKLYELARQGEVPAEIKPREVSIARLEVRRFQPATQSTPPRALLHIECGGGTYIRSLVRDIGYALHSAATMTFLVRTRNGHFSIEDAHPVEAIEKHPTAALLPMQQILPLCATATVVNDEATENLSQGRLTRASEEMTAERVLFLNAASTQAALAIPSQKAAGFYQAEKVFDLRI